MKQLEDDVKAALRAVAIKHEVVLGILGMTAMTREAAAGLNPNRKVCATACPDAQAQLGCRCYPAQRINTFPSRPNMLQSGGAVSWVMDESTPFRKVSSSPALAAPYGPPMDNEVIEPHTLYVDPESRHIGGIVAQKTIVEMPCADAAFLKACSLEVLGAVFVYPDPSIRRDMEHPWVWPKSPVTPDPAADVELHPTQRLWPVSICGR